MGRRVSESDVRIGKVIAAGFSVALLIFAISIGLVLGVPVVAVVISAIFIAVAIGIGLWFGDWYWKANL